MREIKAWDKEMERFHDMVWCDTLIKDINNQDRFKFIQHIGVEDYDGKPIFEGDILNICFTSDSGTFIHDGIYTANIDTFNGVNFRFNELSWIDHGHNQ